MVRVVERVRVQSAVPVHAHAREELGRLRVFVQGLGPICHVILIVVESQNLDVGLLGSKHRAEVVTHEARHVLGRPEHRLPADSGLGLVLHRHAPQVDAVRAVRRDELGKVLGPRPLVLRIETVWLGRDEH